MRKSAMILLLALASLTMPVSAQTTFLPDTLHACGEVKSHLKDLDPAYPYTYAFIIVAKKEIDFLGKSDMVLEIKSNYEIDFVFHLPMKNWFITSWKKVEKCPEVPGLPKSKPERTKPHRLTTKS